MIVSVLGLGSIGLRHANNLLALGHGVIGYDPDAGRRELLAGAGGSIAECRDEALDRGRATVIATPSGLHLDDLDAAIQAGCHILVEKPVAHSADLLEPLLRQSRDLVVFVGQSLRVHPCVLAARAAIEDGRLGDVLWCRSIVSAYLPDWRPGQDYRTGYAADPRTGGVMFDCIHEFDLAAFLLGPFRTVAAAARHTGSLEIEAEDCADAVLRHERGVLTNLHMDYVTRVPQRKTEIAGTDGSIVIDIPMRAYTLTKSSGFIGDAKCFDHERGYGAEPSTQADDYVTEMKCFLACIAGEADPPCDGWAALDVLKQVISARELAGLPSA